MVMITVLLNNFLSLLHLLLGLCYYYFKYILTKTLSYVSVTNDSCIVNGILVKYF